MEKKIDFKIFLAILYHVMVLISKFYHRRDAYRYAIQFDPIPLLLNPISSYGHVDEKIEIPDLLGKHKIEYYIIVLVRIRSKKTSYRYLQVVYGKNSWIGSYFTHLGL